jgi:transmembrane sensor
VRVAAGTLTPGQQQALNSWLDADLRHRGAYVRARAQWADLDRLAALHGPASSSTAAYEGRSGISRRELLAAGVAVTAVVGGGWTWLTLRPGQVRYASGIGEVRRIALGDGSTLMLNTDSEVTVRFNARTRNLRLVRGEALFEVAHDKQRPFLVDVNDIVVRAVGTAFAVRLEAAQVDVTVTEGVVEVAGTKRVAANERATIVHSQAPQVRSIARAESDRRLAWRTGMVSFDGESLRMAVAEINRHNRRQILVDDPVLGAKPVVGVFRATDPEGFSATAALALKATAVTDGDVIRLQTGSAQTAN